MFHTILIVDDSGVIRQSLRACIEQSAKWRVCGEAENGKVAVEKVKELHPDAVILDLQMPVMDGLEAARQISNIAPNTAMVMFTVHLSEQLSKYAKTVGIGEVFSKAEAGPYRLLASLEKLCALTA